jgi:hypothetical protein
LSNLCEKYFRDLTKLQTIARRILFKQNNQVASPDPSRINSLAKYIAAFNSLSVSFKTSLKLKIAKRKEILVNLEKQIFESIKGVFLEVSQGLKEMNTTLELGNPTHYLI